MFYTREVGCFIPWNPGRGLGVQSAGCVKDRIWELLCSRQVVQSECLVIAKQCPPTSCTGVNDEEGAGAGDLSFPSKNTSPTSPLRHLELLIDAVVGGKTGPGF